MHVIAETKRLILRSWLPADAYPLLDMYSDDSVTKHIPHVRLADLPSAEKKVQEMIDLEAEKGFTLWAVVERETDELVGVCGFRASPAERALEIGFAFRKASWGRGYAREAATACLRWAEETLGMRRALASVRPENVPSRRVLDSLGFADTGLRSEDGVWCIYERSLTGAAAL